MDLCGFLTEPALTPLCYASGLPVMRGDVSLLYHSRACEFVSAAAGRIVRIEAFDPDAHSESALAKIGVYGAPGVTDLASIPALARAVFPPNGRYLKAALKHDHAYETAGFGRLIVRARADAELLADMKALRCRWIERETIYCAVRLGGGKGWGH